VDKERFDKGMVVRREVLGDEYVDRSLANATDFSMEMQELATEYAWGEIWSRDGLTRAERSLLNLGLLSALNRGHEFKVHVRGAINNGVTREQIKEVLLQVAVYCGAPAGLEAFRLAGEVLAELDSA
jgi:4-carboxymuconolactone decarboxylase